MNSTQPLFLKRFRDRYVKNAPFLTIHSGLTILILFTILKQIAF